MPSANLERRGMQVVAIALLGISLCALRRHLHQRGRMAGRAGRRRGLRIFFLNKHKKPFQLKKKVYFCISKMKNNSLHINVRNCFLNIKKRDVYGFVCHR